MHLPFLQDILSCMQGTPSCGLKGKASFLYLERADFRPVFTSVPASADLCDHFRKDPVQVTDDPVVGYIEDQSPGVFVDRDDAGCVPHTDDVLN